MRFAFQSVARNLPIFMADSADHLTGKTGLTLTIEASKDGGSFASITPTVTELAHGWYLLALTTSHTDTIGDLALHITASGADPSDVLLQVVSPTRGLAGTALPDAECLYNASLLTVGENEGQLSTKTDGIAFADAVQINNSATAASNARNFFDGTGYAGTNNVIPTVTNLSNLPTAPANWLTATAIENGAFTAAKFASGAFDAVWSVATRSLTTFGSLIADIYTYFTGDSRQNTFRADVSGLAEAADLDDVASDVAAIKVTTDKLDDTLEDNSGTYRFTAAALAEAPTGGSAPTESEIYTYFTSENRDDAFKADVSGLALETSLQGLITTVGAAGAGLTAIPWNSAWDAEVQSEVTDALDAFGWATTEVILTSAYDAAKTAASQGDVTDARDAILLEGANWVTADVSGLSTFDPATQQVTVATNNDKTGYALASDGLDAISITEPTGMATTFREMVIASWMIGYGKQIKDGDAGTIEVYAADGTTVVTTQTYTVVGEVETVNRGT
jgi:hypothetical protein